jgi:UDP-N-acetylmuramyl pentapeptide phosphotransferase/UDP-N-acetylglucosamine-1-phosphate transferase
MGGGIRILTPMLPVTHHTPRMQGGMIFCGISPGVFLFHKITSGYWPSSLCEAIIIALVHREIIFRIAIGKIGKISHKARA